METITQNTTVESSQEAAFTSEQLELIKTLRTKLHDTYFPPEADEVDLEAARDRQIFVQGRVNYLRNTHEDWRDYALFHVLANTPVPDSCKKFDFEGADNVQAYIEEL